MSRAIFLDRDGTINREVDNLRHIRQLRILRGVPSAIKKLNRLGYLAIVITNQPVIARGWLTEEQTEEIHRTLVARLVKKGAHIDAVYYCPHHPNANLLRYRKRCRCRKPNSGMIKKAAKEHGINLRKSFMVGDHAWDIIAGKRAKLRTILVRTSARSVDPAYADVKPDFTAKNLIEAVRIIREHAT